MADAMTGYRCRWYLGVPSWAGAGAAPVENAAGGWDYFEEGTLERTLKCNI